MSERNTGGHNASMTTDWVEWNGAYDDPDSALSRRRAAAVELIGSALDRAPRGDIRLLSLCAGDAGDIAKAITNHQRRPDIVGRAIELNPHLAKEASLALDALTTRIDVVCGDAADPRLFGDLPVDLFLLIGVFGNVPNEDVKRVIDSVPAICRPDATIIWTRFRRAPDLTPSIREWFDGVDCCSTAFVSPGIASWAIGAELFSGPHEPQPIPSPLFTFPR